MSEYPSETNPDTDPGGPPRRSARGWLISDKPLARIARNLLWLMSGKGVSAILSLVYLGVATRTLGVEDFGRFALILSMGSAIALFAQFDCWQVVMRFGAVHLHADRRDALGRLIAACRLFDLIGFVVGALIAVAATVLAVHLGWWEQEMARGALLYCLAILAAIRSTPMGLLRLHHRFDLSTYAETMVPLVRMAGTVTALLLKPDITGFLIAWAVSELASAIAFWWLAWRIDADALAWRHSLAFRDTLREEKGLLPFLGVTNLGVSIAGLTNQAPVLLLGGFTGPVAAGLFRLAFQLSRALAKVSTLISRSTYAELNHVRASGAHHALRKLLRKTDRIALFAGIALLAIVLILGKPILWLIAGSEFAGAYPILVVLGLAIAIDFIGINYEPALLAATSGTAVLKRRLGVAAILLLLLALLLPPFGAMGAAWSIAGASAAAFLLFRVAVRRHIHDSGEAEEEAEQKTR